MSRLFYHVMQDNLGNLLFDVSGTMRLAGTGTAATIYGDEALTIPIANPMTNHPSFGSFKCFLGAGDYDFYLAKSGYTFETLTGVQGHGTMAQQDAANVAITGGAATLHALRLTPQAGDPIGVLCDDRAGPYSALYGNVSAGTSKRNLDIQGTAENYIKGNLGIGTFPDANQKLHILFDKTNTFGLKFRQTVSDAGGGQPIGFNNAADGNVGSITTTGTTTAFNTSSDARLKHAIAPLTGALDVVAALRPIAGRWKADDSPLVGFLAHEVAEVVDGVITGDRDAVDDEGQMVPQMIDYSKLVPWLVSACQELAQQVQVLTARLEAAGRP